MIAAAETALTLAGFVGLASIALAAIGLARQSAGKTAALRERIARLEAIVADHLENGARHKP